LFGGVVGLDGVGLVPAIKMESGLGHEIGANSDDVAKGKAGFADFIGELGHERAGLGVGVAETIGCGLGLAAGKGLDAGAGREAPREKQSRAKGDADGFGVEFAGAATGRESGVGLGRDTLEREGRERAGSEPAGTDEQQLVGERKQGSGFVGSSGLRVVGAES